MCIEIVWVNSVQFNLYTTQHTAHQPILHAYFHIQDHKYDHKNANSNRLTSTKLSEILQSSVHQLTYKTLSIITSPMQQNTNHQLRSINTHHSTDAALK